MSAKHTPGPWSAHFREDVERDLLTEEWWCIEGPGADVHGYMTAADARLIAAAPDLLEALRITAGNIRSLGPAGALAQVYEPYTQWLAMADAAIAKATGAAA